MADSDKRAILAKRKLQLKHAVRNELAPEYVAKRIEKVRSAALAVLKKYRGAFANVTDAPGNQAWELQKQEWSDLTHPQILNICETWPENPNIQHVRLS